MAGKVDANREATAMNAVAVAVAVVLSITLCYVWLLCVSILLW